MAGGRAVAGGAVRTELGVGNEGRGVVHINSSGTHMRMVGCVSCTLRAFEHQPAVGSSAQIPELSHVLSPTPLRAGQEPECIGLNS